MSDPRRQPLLALPAGVTGIPRLREWDAVVLVEVPELEGSALDEVELSAEPGRPLLVTGAERRRRRRWASGSRTRSTRRSTGRTTASPSARTGGRWAVGARAGRAGEAIEPPGRASRRRPSRSSATPDGDRSAEADGEPLDPVRRGALRRRRSASSQRRGAARFESFVARADRAGDGRWRVSRSTRSDRVPLDPEWLTNYGGFEKVLRLGEGPPDQAPRRSRRRTSPPSSPTSRALSDEELAAKTVEFRERIDERRVASRSSSSRRSPRSARPARRIAEHAPLRRPGDGRRSRSTRARSPR